MIPLGGGALYDAWIIARGKDLNGRELSLKEKEIRGAFAVLGILPVAGVAAKAGKLGSTLQAVYKSERAISTLSTGARVAYNAIELAKI